jgi:hypothetical protein
MFLVITAYDVSNGYHKDLGLGLFPYFLSGEISCSCGGVVIVLKMEAQRNFDQKFEQDKVHRGFLTRLSGRASAHFMRRGRQSLLPTTTRNPLHDRHPPGDRWAARA